MTPKNDRDKLSPSLTTEERLEILIDGSEELGVIGIRGRLEDVDKRLGRVDRWLVILTVVNIVHISITSLHLAGEGNTVVSGLFKSLFALLAGG